MKNVKFRLFFAAFAIAISISIAATVPAKDSTTIYRYNSELTSFSAMRNVNNWVEGTLSCTDGTIPCQITYNGSDFAQYLSEFEDEEDILAATDGNRSPQ